MTLTAQEVMDIYNQKQEINVELYILGLGYPQWILESSKYGSSQDAILWNYRLNERQCFQAERKDDGIRVQ
jgi:hypothetical protein